MQRYYAETRFEQLKLKCNSCQTFVSRFRIHLALWPDISFMSRSIIPPKVVLYETIKMFQPLIDLLARVIVSAVSY